MRENAWQMLKSSKYMQRSLEKDNGHLLVHVPKRSGILWKRTVHKEFAIVVPNVDGANTIDKLRDLELGNEVRKVLARMLFNF